MKVAICDDDSSARGHYTELIKLVADNHGISTTVDCYQKGEQLLFALDDKKDPYDIVFLDIFMPSINGIDVGTQLRKAGFIGSIIYLTRSKEHMLSAFDVGASNYVLKGNEYESDRFERVFIKAMKEVEQRKRKYLLLNGISEHRNIAIDTIRYFEVSKHICIVYYGKGESFEFVSSLGKIENKLLSFGFVRVHRSFLVNCARVKSFTFKQIIMDDDVQIPVGRKHAANFRQTIKDFSEIDISKEV